MPNHNIFYFDNTFAAMNVPNYIGPFHPGNVNRFVGAECHGECSGGTFNTSVGFVTANDIMWGLQWVAHGAAPISVITGAVDDHWLWRQNLGTKTDLVRGWGPQSTTATIESIDSLWARWRGQGIKPVADIDLYIACQSSFGLVLSATLWLGSVDIWFV